MTKVSVIIPVWNGANYLSEAIESALAQDYESKEIIVVDDGSTDNTDAVIQTFGKKIRSIYQDNKGLGASRNTGIKVAKGDYLAFLDHDDVWDKTKLSAQMNLMNAHRTDDPLIFSQVKQFICPRLSPDAAERVSVNQAVLPGYIAGSLLLSRKRFEQIGYFVEAKQLGEFIDWYLRALEKNVPVCMLNQVGLYRRVHQDNMGRQHDLYQRSDYLKILKASLARRRQLNR